MAYEKDKDKKLFEKEADFGKHSIVVAVYQYEDGEPKLQLNKKVFSESGSMFTKIGRLSIDELNQVLPLIEEAKKFMTKKGDDS